MHFGQLSEWNVPESEAEVPRGCAVQAERALRKWSLFGQARAQNLPVTDPAEGRIGAKTWASAARYSAPPSGARTGTRDGSARRSPRGSRGRRRRAPCCDLTAA